VINYSEGVRERIKVEDGIIIKAPKGPKMMLIGNKKELIG
jgi:hypothetical protein